MANQLHYRRDHYGEQRDRGQGVEYRYGKHYIFHDLGFLFGSQQLDITAATMFHHLHGVLMTLPWRTNGSATRRTTVIATGSRA
jgi:hypothetical protein